MGLAGMQAIGIGHGLAQTTQLTDCQAQHCGVKRQQPTGKEW